MTQPEPRPSKTPNSLLYLALTRTPTHAGCGAGLDDIDLPIQRSTSTQLPIFTSSTVKGVLRQHAPQEWGCNPNEVIALFGPERDKASEHAGMLTPQDAQLLALPVASLQGGWAWVTCTGALSRMRRDALASASSIPPHVPPEPGQRCVHVPAKSPLVFEVSPAPGAAPNVVMVLHELTRSAPAATPADVTAQAACAEWGVWLAQHAFAADEAKWRASFAERLVIVPDADFTHLSLVATEVRSRVSLNADRTPKNKALWREECLPADSLLWGMIGAQRVAASGLCSETEALARVKPATLQLGGKASVGYGWVEFLPLRSPAPGQTEAKD